MILRALNFWVYGHMRLAELTDDPNNRHLRIATERLALIWKEYVLMLNEESMITLENGTPERTLAADAADRYHAQIYVLQQSRAHLVHKGCRRIEQRPSTRLL